MPRLLILLLLTLATAWPAPRLSARVTDVHDGDSLKVVVGGAVTRVRLHSIDAPELKQPGGPDSQAFLEALVGGQMVELEPHGEDRYGRMLAVVYLRGKNVNLEMVRSGWAWWFRRYAPSDRVLEQAESQARARRLGLWAGANPQAPWDFRHRP